MACVRHEKGGDLAEPLLRIWRGVHDAKNVHNLWSHAIHNDIRQSAGDQRIRLKSAACVEPVHHFGLFNELSALNLIEADADLGSEPLVVGKQS